jgi:hypothetical protein
MRRATRLDAVEDPVCHLIPERGHRFAVALGDGDERQVERGERGDALVQGRDRVVADQLSLDAVGDPLEPDERFRDAVVAVVEEDHRETVQLNHRDPFRQYCVRSGCQVDPSGRASRDGRATAPSPVLRTTVSRPASTRSAHRKRPGERALFTDTATGAVVRSALGGAQEP